MTPAPPPNQQNLIASLVADLRPVKVVSYAGVYARCFVVVLGVLLTATFVMGLRSDWSVKMRDATYLVFLCGAFAGFLLSLAGVVALALPSHCETTKRHLIWFGVLPFFLGLVTLILAEMTGASHHVLSWDDAKCGATLISLAAIPLVIFTAQISQLAPFQSLRAAFGIGLSALSAGTIFLQWHCASDNSFHLALWHFLPVVPVAAVVAAMTHKALRRWEKG